MSVRFTWEAPPEYREALKPHLAHWKHVVPPWCYEVSVLAADSAEGNLLSMETMTEYRRANLYVHPACFPEKVRSRSEFVLHEILHIQVEAMRRLAQKFMQCSSYAEDEAMKAAAEKEIVDTTEATIQDLMVAMRGK